MNRLPEPIQRLAAAFGRLPGVGPKTALRYAYSLLARHQTEAEQLARALTALHSSMTRCGICGLYAEQNPCLFCADPTRDTSLLCIVATSRDVHAMEGSGAYKGKYHVLGGHLDALEGILPEHLNINSLLERLRSGKIHEVILAFNPDIPGEATALYLARLLQPLNIALTELARGLQTGSDLEYVDPLTLGEALEGRRPKQNPVT